MRTARIFLFLTTVFISINLKAQQYTNGQNLVGLRPSSAYVIAGNNNSGDGTAIEFYGNGVSGTEAGSMHFVSGVGSSSSTNSFLFAHYDGTSWPSLFILKKDGRVGFGNFQWDWDLSAKFQIGSDYKMMGMGDLTFPSSIDPTTVSNIAGTSYIGFNAALQNDGYTQLRSNGSYNGGALIRGSYKGGLAFIAFPSGQFGAGANSQWASPADFLTYTAMQITPDQKVVIGNTSTVSNINISTTPGFKLLVAGGIITDKFRIATVNSTNWADFVFAPEYKLRPLNEVESFIKENHHLPEVPSAEEVSEQGVDVIEMEAKLLQKIEELTLYMIKQQKQIEELEKKNKILEEKISE